MDLWVFLSAVFGHWIAILSGGLITVAIWFWEHRRNRSMSWIATTRVVGAVLLISSYQAWHDEYLLRTAQDKTIAAIQSELSQKTARIEDLRDNGKIEVVNGPAPMISFAGLSKIVFRHGLHTLAPKIDCFDSQHKTMRTWGEPRVIDENTIEYDFGKPKTGTCTATGGDR
jgi:hypothetical protein